MYSTSIKKIFTLDYTRELKFQAHSDQPENPPAQSLPIPASASDDTLKGSFQLYILT